MDLASIKKFFASLTLQKLVPVILIVVIGLLLVKLLLKLFDRVLERSRLERTMFSFLRAVMRALLYTILVLVAASSLGVDVTSLVAILSVVSLAISLAVQNALSNVVGSVTLLTTHPFHVGDFVEIGSDSGTVADRIADQTQSMLAGIGTVFAPIFAPLGFADWRCATALISGFIAKESVVSTLQILLGASAVSTLFTTKTALSFLVFTLLYTPCVAAIAAIRREVGSAPRAALIALTQCCVAWLAAFVLYQLVLIL